MSLDERSRSGRGWETRSGGDCLLAPKVGTQRAPTRCQTFPKHTETASYRTKAGCWIQPQAWESPRSEDHRFSSLASTKNLLMSRERSVGRIWVGFWVPETHCVSQRLLLTRPQGGSSSASLGIRSPQEGELGQKAPAR